MDRICRRIAAGYFALQGIAVIVWWGSLLYWPELQRLFFEPEIPRSLVLSFALPDLTLVGLGSLVAAILVSQARPESPIVAWGIVACLSYAMLFCVSSTLLESAAFLGSSLMVCATLLSIHAAILTTGAPLGTFRKHRGSTRAAAVHTTLQVMLCWGLFLGVLPWWLASAQDELGVTRFQFAGQQAFATALFLLFGSLGLASAGAMIRSGCGTPLPMKGPQQLVQDGPYSMLRNPMAVAGLGQGAAVGIGLGSIWVITYSALGAVIWHLIIRPVEECYLQREFGVEYEHYRHRVRCWWPRLSNAQPVAD